MEPHPAELIREGPLPALSEVLHCQISSWYPTFAKLPPNSLRRTKGTIQTAIIDLPDDFRAYLKSDGIKLPTGSKTSSFLPPERDIADDEDNDAHDADDNAQPSTPKAFPDLDSRIEAAIDTLGGSVAPKLNWSAPKDSIWINSGTLKCQTPGDIYLLLKSSDFCSYDIHHALWDVQDAAVDDAAPEEFRLQLALRKWCHLYPSQEFRCFVKGHDLVAISQRHDSQHFPHLKRDAYMIKSLIVEFFDEIVQNKFAGGVLSQYIFDCYLDQQEKVWLLDFNVWGRRTDTLLFSWDELEAMDSDMPEIRVAETEKQVRSDPLASYRAPIDAIHVASVTGGDPKAFEAFMKLCEQSDGCDSEDSE